MCRPNAVQHHPKYAPVPVLPFLSFISSGRRSQTGGHTVDCGSLISGRDGLEIYFFKSQVKQSSRLISRPKVKGGKTKTELTEEILV